MKLSDSVVLTHINEVLCVIHTIVKKKGKDYSIKEPGKQSKYGMYYDINRNKQTKNCRAGRMALCVQGWACKPKDWSLDLQSNQRPKWVLLESQYLEDKDREAILGTNWMARITELLNSWFNILDREQLGKTLSINLQSPHMVTHICIYMHNIYPHNTCLNTNAVLHSTAQCRYRGC